MGQVTLTPRAQIDLEEIWLHVAIDAPRAADRLIDQIVARCRAFGRHPRLGEARQEIAPEARMLAIGNYLVLYRIVEPDIDIVRIVHGARQVEGIFDTPKGLDED